MKRTWIVLLAVLLVTTLVCCAIAGFGMVASANGTNACGPRCAGGSACTETGECSEACGQQRECKKSCKCDRQRSCGNGECSQQEMRGGCLGRGGCAGQTDS